MPILVRAGPTSWKGKAALGNGARLLHKTVTVRPVGARIAVQIVSEAARSGSSSRGCVGSKNSRKGIGNTKKHNRSTNCNNRNRSQTKDNNALIAIM